MTEEKLEQILSNQNINCSNFHSNHVTRDLSHDQNQAINMTPNHLYDYSEDR